MSARWYPLVCTVLLAVVAVLWFGAGLMWLAGGNTVRGWFDIGAGVLIAGMVVWLWWSK